MESDRRLLADLGCIFCDSPEVFSTPTDLGKHLESFHEKYYLDTDVK
jgi:hypothetical protein